MFKIVALVFLFSFISRLGAESADDFIKTARYHSILQDYPNALRTIQEAQKLFPNNPSLERQHILILAQSQAERQTLQVLKKYQEKYPGLEQEIFLLEAVAWSILKQHLNSSVLSHRLAALSGAGITRDTYTHDMLITAFHDQYAAIRQKACEICAQLKVRELSPLLLKLAETDPSLQVRKSALETLGNLKIPALKTIIHRKLSDKGVAREERLIMSKALALLDDHIPYQNCLELIQSKDPIIQCLGIEYAIHKRLKEATPLLIKLLNTPSKEVLTDSLHALAMLWPDWKDNVSQAFLPIERCTQSVDPFLAIPACWIFSLLKTEEGTKKLTAFLQHPNAQVRTYAIAVLSVLGGRNPSVLYQVLRDSSLDLFVRLNAAIGLLRVRKHEQEAIALIENVLRNPSIKIGIKSWDPVKAFIDSKYNDKSEHPELEDVISRLEIVNLLAILKVPSASKILEDFLNSRAWGIGGMASLLLLKEGHNHVIDMLENMLVSADSTPRLKLQAALVLAFWSQSEATLQPLISSYEKAEKGTKERILSALANVRSIQSIPFLIHCLQESAPSLRIQAAATLLQVLYY